LANPFPIILMIGLYGYLFSKYYQCR
jgi:hypothetical protein